MPIEISYKYSLAGAEDVKKRLKEINAEYDRGELSIEKYRKGLADIDRDSKSLNRTTSITKNLYLATHPALGKLTRAMSTFGSVSRTSMSIMNSLNLANLTSSSINSGLAQTTADLAQIEREIALERSKNIPDIIKLANLEGERNALIEKQKEELQNLNQTKLDGIITAISGLGTAISTTFSLLMTNGKIRDAVIRAGSFLGGVFGGFFTLVSKAAIAALDWLFPSLTGAKAMGAAGSGGSKLGTTFGLSFVGGAAAAIAGAITGAVLGAITFPSIDEILRKNLPGYADWADFREGPMKNSLDKTFGVSPELRETFDGMDKGRDVLNGKGVVGNIGKKSVKEEVSLFQPLIDLFTKGLPEAYGETETHFNETFVTNIPNSIAATAPLITEGFKSLWNGVIATTNAAGSAMVSATNSIFQSLINALNSMIRAYNTAAKKIGKPTVSPVIFSPISYTAIPMIAAAKGFEGIVNSPTMFLAGEAGPEHVAVTPSGKNSGVTLIQYMTFQGSLLAERELGRLSDKHLKDALLKVGFKKPITS